MTTEPFFLKSEHGRHSIEAGYERGKFWRQAPFVEVGEPVIYDVNIRRSKILENTLMGDMRDVTGDEYEDDEDLKLMLGEALYIVNALTGGNKDGR